MKGIASLLGLFIIVGVVALAVWALVLNVGIRDFEEFKRVLLEVSIIQAINDIEFVKKAQDQALTFSFYKAYDYVGKRGGYSDLSGLNSLDCTPYWRVYDEINVPSQLGLLNNIQSVSSTVFNKYMDELEFEGLSIPSYTVAIKNMGGFDRLWCREKQCTGVTTCRGISCGSNCRIPETCIEVGSTEPICEYIEGSCSYIGCREGTRRVCQTTCEENLFRCPPVNTFEVEATTLGNLEFDTEDLVIQEGSKLSHTFLSCLVKEVELGKDEFINTNNIELAIQDAINSITEDCNNREVELSNKIEQDIFNLQKTVNNIRIILDVTETQISYSEIPDASCGGGFRYENYRAAANVLVIIEKNNEFFPVDDEMKNIPLEFRVLEGNLVIFPNTGPCGETL